MALGDLGGGHAGVRGVGEHQEQVRVERTTHSLAAVHDVIQQVLEVQVDLERGLDPVRLPVVVRHSARERLHVAVLHGRRHLKRRLGLVVDGLRLAELLVLELLDVSERLHARAVAVDVAANYRPARAERREVLEPALAQEHAFLAADLEVIRTPRHVLGVALADVAVGARLDGVDHGHPLVKVPGAVHVLHRHAALLEAELLDHLRDGHLELAVQRADAALRVG